MRARFSYSINHWHSHFAEQKKKELKGTVRFIFQPAEEIAAGARMVIEAGGLDGVSAIFGMHNKPDLPAGTIGLKEGALMASVDRFEILVRGKGGHSRHSEQQHRPDRCRRANRQRLAISRQPQYQLAAKRGCQHYKNTGRKLVERDPRSGGNGRHRPHVSKRSKRGRSEAYGTNGRRNSCGLRSTG